MPKRAIAQAGGGDPRVLAHPSFREIPKCLFPLSTKEAKQEYDKIALMLFDAGALTAGKHRQLSIYAMQFDIVHRYPSEGKMLKAANFVQLQKALADLRLDEIDKPIAASETARTNKFALCGFAARGRSDL